MAFVADDLVAWFIGLLANAARERLTTSLLGSDQERALQQAAAHAVQLTAGELWPEDGERAGHLAMVINEFFANPLAGTSLSGHATLLQALQAGIAARLEPLSDADLTGAGASAADLLGVASPALAGKLTSNLLRTIVIRGAGGGPLAPLASQLNHDATHLQGQRIEGMIGQLAEVVREALDRPPSGAASARTISNLPAGIRHFTGRAELLGRLAGMLGQDRAAVVAIHGLGGIGKTQLAREYAWAHRDEYRVIWWLRASNAVELAAGFTGLAQALGLDKVATGKDMRGAVRSELANRSDWLLIFDNASDAELVRAFLPAGDGHVLITSRMRIWTGLAETCAVGELAPEEAVSYLGVSIGRDDPEIADLAVRLGCLPLALAQAAGYIGNHGCSAAFYLDLYRAAGPRLLAERPAPHGYPETVATTWLLSFDSLTKPPRELLRLVSLLAPDSIPLDLLFATAPADSLPQALTDAARDPFAREAAIGELVSTSLVSRLDNNTIQVHRLVQEITRSRLDKRDTAIWTQHAVQLIQAAIPDEPNLREHWDRMSSLAPHAQTVAMRVAPHQREAYPAAMILHDLGAYLKISNCGGYRRV